MFFDPTSFGKEYYEEMNKKFIEQFNQVLRNPAFLSEMTKNMASGLENKKVFDDAMKKYLESANLPTRDDFAKVMQYLQAIESRIITLEEKLEDMEDKIDKISGGA